MFLEKEIGTTVLEKVVLFNIFAQNVFTSTDCQSKPELKSPMKIEKMHFTQSEIKPALENFDVAKTKSPDELGDLQPKKTVELTVQIIITSLQHSCKKYT